MSDNSALCCERTKCETGKTAGWVGKQLKVGKRIVSLVSLLVEKARKKNVYPYTLKKLLVCEKTG